VLRGDGRTQCPSSCGPPVVAAAPAAPRPKVPDEPIVATWRDCIGRALQSYEQSHNVHALQAATGSCQLLLEEQGGADYAGAGPRWRRLRLMADGTSAAAGGPSAAMPTATALLGVGASDDRKWTRRIETQNSPQKSPRKIGESGNRGWLRRASAQVFGLPGLQIDGFVAARGRGHSPIVGCRQAEERHL
jgi:hypothetical protein